MPAVHTRSVSVDVSILTKNDSLVKKDWLPDDFMAELETLLTALVEEKIPGAVVEISTNP